MSDQTPDIPDETPDAALTTAQRQQVRDLAQRMIDHGNGSIPDDEQAQMPPWLVRRAWRRYQARFEAKESDREAAARQRAAAENHEVAVVAERRIERQRRRGDSQGG
jgi:hypothetical protein